MVRIELRVEPTAVIGSDRGDPQSGEPGISHRSHVAPPSRGASIKPRRPSSQVCGADNEKVVASLLTYSITFDIYMIGLLGWAKRSFLMTQLRAGTL